MFVFFGPASYPVAATGTDNPNGLQQEPELLTIPGLWINRKNGNHTRNLCYQSSVPRAPAGYRDHRTATWRWQVLLAILTVLPCLEILHLSAQGYRYADRPRSHAANGSDG